MSNFEKKRLYKRRRVKEIKMTSGLIFFGGILVIVVSIFVGLVLKNRSRYNKSKYGIDKFE